MDAKTISKMLGDEYNFFESDWDGVNAPDLLEILAELFTLIDECIVTYDPIGSDRVCDCCGEKGTTFTRDYDGIVLNLCSINCVMA